MLKEALVEQVKASNTNAQALLDDFENVRLSAAGTTSTAQERRARDEAIWKKYNTFREQPSNDDVREGVLRRDPSVNAASFLTVGIETQRKHLSCS